MSTANEEAQKQGVSSRVPLGKGVHPPLAKIADDVNGDADADAAVGDIKGWVAVSPKVKIEKIDDATEGNAVNHVANDAANQ